MSDQEKKEEQPPAEAPPAQEEAKAAEPAPAEAPAAAEEAPAEDSLAVDQKGKDEFYEDDFKAKELVDSSISRRNFAFHGVFGIPSMKRYNIHFLSQHEIIFATGNKYQTYNMQTEEFKTYHGKDRDGIGSIAVHPA